MTDSANRSEQQGSAAANVVERAPLNGTGHTRSTPDGTGERLDLPITG